MRWGLFRNDGGNGVMRKAVGVVSSGGALVDNSLVLVQLRGAEQHDE
jgi:hypothetical protein